MSVSVTCECVCFVRKAENFVTTVGTPAAMHMQNVYS